MTPNALAGGFADAPLQSAVAFRAALRAMARPGEVQTLTGATAPEPVPDAAATLLLTLCDPETPIHLAGVFDTPAIVSWLAFHCGAPLASATDCTFALGHWADLQPLQRFRIGTADYPDRSATLIIADHDFDTSPNARLTGPGIRDQALLNLPDPVPFQTNRALFPLGLDVYLIRGDRLVAIPRSTRVEVA